MWLYMQTTLPLLFVLSVFSVVLNHIFIWLDEAFVFFALLMGSSSFFLNKTNCLLHVSVSHLNTWVVPAPLSRSCPVIRESYVQTLWGWTDFLPILFNTLYYFIYITLGLQCDHLEHKEVEITSSSQVQSELSAAHIHSFKIFSVNPKNGKYRMKKWRWVVLWR